MYFFYKSLPRRGSNPPVTVLTPIRPKLPSGPGVPQKALCGLNPAFLMVFVVAVVMVAVAQAFMVVFVAVFVIEMVRMCRWWMHLGW